jgi:hypothetical protein
MTEARYHFHISFSKGKKFPMAVVYLMVQEVAKKHVYAFYKGIAYKKSENIIVVLDVSPSIATYFSFMHIAYADYS